MTPQEMKQIAESLLPEVRTRTINSIVAMKNGVIEPEYEVYTSTHPYFYYERTYISKVISRQFSLVMDEKKLKLTGFDLNNFIKSPEMKEVMQKVYTTFITEIQDEIKQRFPLSKNAEEWFDTHVEDSIRDVIDLLDRIIIGQFVMQTTMLKQHASDPEVIQMTQPFRNEFGDGFLNSYGYQKNMLATSIVEFLKGRGHDLEKMSDEQLQHVNDLIDEATDRMIVQMRRDKLI